MDLKNPQRLPSLEALAFVADWYRRATTYTDSYRELLYATGDSIDLTQASHRKALLVWLNRWGCRQFKICDHPIASESLASWHAECAHLLPDVDQELLICSRETIMRLAQAYDRLRDCRASYKHRGRQRIEVRWGPAGASKTLFALRPNIAVPWDNKQRVAFGYRVTGQDYGDYIKHICDVLRVAEQKCNAYGIKIADIPTLVDRPEATMTKLVDEFYWAVYTRNKIIPDEIKLEQWFIEKIG